MLLTDLLITRTHRPTENVSALELLSDCYGDYYMPIQVLACPDVDYMRLLPVEERWEDPTDTGLKRCAKLHVSCSLLIGRQDE